MTGAEASPGAGHAAWYEDHGNLDVAHAFAVHAQATGDERFLRDEAAPVLAGVADWLTTRVTWQGNRASLRRTMGIAERSIPADNDAFTVMAAKVVLNEAIWCAERMGREAPSEWRRVERGLRLRTSRSTGAILSHDGFHPNEEKGATPGPLAGLFPLGFQVSPQRELATAKAYIGLAPGYIGSPMLSAFYGVWAAWSGDRRGSLRLLREGYADLVTGRFDQTLEYLPSKFPEEPPAGPFFANLSGFLGALLYGLPGIRIGPEDPASWPRRPVILPAGWRRIEVERAWFRLRPTELIAEHGADKATLRTTDGLALRSVA